MTIRTRLALWYSGLLALLIISFGVAVITISRLTLLQTLDSILAGQAQNLASIIDTAPLEASSTVFTYRDEQAFRSPGILIQIWRTHENGSPIDPVLERHSGLADDANTPLDASLFNKNAISFNSTVISGVPERVVALPIYTDEGLPIGLIQIATPLHAITNANDQILLITVISAMFVIAVSIGLGMWLSKHLLKPVEAVKEAATQISKTQDLSTRMQLSGVQDELGELGAVFNHMMERLEHLFKVQQEFIGDVSHELRTPLTSIIGNVELINKYGFDKESMEAIQREAERMSRMVNDLLLLSRADIGAIQMDMYPMDLDKIVLEAYEEALSMAKSRQLHIMLKKIETIKILGNPDRMRQLLRNLMSNAIKFTKDEGKISISVYTQGEKAFVDVQDTGIGISEDDKKRIFDRFFQANKARDRQDELDGPGLGLSIVRWIVDAHGGTIEVESKLGEGTRFRLELPLSAKGSDNDGVNGDDGDDDTRPNPKKKLIVTKRDAQK
jgi:two-component system OmpR family sensor kinase